MTADFLSTYQYLIDLDALSQRVDARSILFFSLQPIDARSIFLFLLTYRNRSYVAQSIPAV